MVAQLLWTENLTMADCSTHGIQRAALSDEQIDQRLNPGASFRSTPGWASKYAFFAFPRGAGRTDPLAGWHPGGRTAGGSVRWGPDVRGFRIPLRASRYQGYLWRTCWPPGRGMPLAARSLALAARDRRGVPPVYKSQPAVRFVLRIVILVSRVKG